MPVQQIEIASLAFAEITAELARRKADLVAARAELAAVQETKRCRTAKEPLKPDPASTTRTDAPPLALPAAAPWSEITMLISFHGVALRSADSVSLPDVCFRGAWLRWSH